MPSSSPIPATIRSLANQLAIQSALPSACSDVATASARHKTPLHVPWRSGVLIAATSGRAFDVSSLRASENCERIEVLRVIGSSIEDREQNGNFE